MKESVLSFDCEGEPLVGILAEPDGRHADVGVLIIVGGPQYRVGSHRQFTLLARHLAANGFAALRFDYRGMGDSPGEARDFEGVEADIAAGIEALMSARPGLKGVVLHGLCDAAAAALMYCETRRDTRVLGLTLQNPWFRSEQGEAKAIMTHYYGKRLRSAEFWKKLLSGKVGTGAVRTWLQNRSKACATASAQLVNFRTRMVRAWSQTTQPLALQLASDDLTAREFVQGFDGASTQWRQRSNLTLYEHAGADHTFSDGGVERRVNDELLAWYIREFKT